MAKPDDPGSQGRSNAPGQGGGAPGKSGEPGRGHSPEAKAEREARRARGENVPEPPEDEPSGPTTAPGGDEPQVNPLNKP
jgi:hypothetical protein